MAAKKTATKSAQPAGSSSPASCVYKWVTRAVIAFVLYLTCSFLDRIKDRWYVFTPESLHQLAQAAVRAHPDDINAIIPYIVSNLTAEYPASVTAINTNSSEWVLNNAGGAMGAMYIIHASITEYLIIFGTPLGTEGHTGMHTADDYFNILVGEQWAFDPPKLEREVYRPGEVHHLPRGHVKQYKMHEGCFALEYARGWIPLMLPFGLADVFSSTLDFWTFYHTVRITARENIRNLLIGKI
ncbi:C-8 sterol isomerase [Trametes coccinea BRFM310]|uniref:C-8 sterol isomerase n=1 Tax=Trametes coccinea (strain BRFM310) TaxID=1353009 RepID=A0A1Y2IYY8_TRAC3|nr:C-8 sterol isomerase [Trametes coccinea BRFM310]